MDNSDIISLLTARYKDMVERNFFNELRVGMNDLLSAEADSRREKAAADIIQMAKLKIALRKFEICYSQIQEKYGKLTVIDDYIAEVQMQIKMISRRKNR